MKTKTFKITSLCHATILGNNRALELYYKDEIISYYRISSYGGLKATLKIAKKEAYKEVSHLFKK